MRGEIDDNGGRSIVFIFPLFPLTRRTRPARHILRALTELFFRLPHCARLTTRLRVLLMYTTGGEELRRRAVRHSTSCGHKHRLRSRDTSAIAAVRV